MRFTLYTSKSIKECVSALGERIQEKETKTRPAISGEVDKDGDFIWQTQRKVWGIARQTRMTGHLKRENNSTFIYGFVHEGIAPKQIYIVMGGGLLMAALFFFSGQGIGGILLGIISVLTYPYFVGDYHNSQYLLKELKKTLNSKDKPPVASTSTAKSGTPPSKRPASPVRAK